jgi:menaquinone-dependent protoporphyrinogen oxidase
MSAAGGKPDPYVGKFIHQTGWRPGRTVSFAGALPYTRYNPLIRFVMKRISRKAGHTTDTSRDHDFTDWGSVRSFANDIADAAARTAPASRPNLSQMPVTEPISVASTEASDAQRP